MFLSIYHLNMTYHLYSYRYIYVCSTYICIHTSMYIASVYVSIYQTQWTQQSIREGGAAWGKFPERKGYLSSVLKEVTELAWCRPGAMGHPRGWGFQGQKLRVRQQGRGNLRVTIWTAGCEGGGWRHAAELSVARHWEGLRRQPGTYSPRLRPRPLQCGWKISQTPGQGLP